MSFDHKLREKARLRYYPNLNESSKVNLLGGVPGTKFNFSNAGQKPVMLKMSHDEKFLSYAPEKATWGNFLSGESKVAVSAISAVKFASVSVNLKKHQIVSDPSCLVDKLRKIEHYDHRRQISIKTSLGDYQEEENVFVEDAKEEESKMVHEWQLVSLALSNGKSLDFAFKTLSDAFIFVHMLGHLRYDSEDGPKLAAIKRLKTKLQILSKSQGVSRFELIQVALLKTMVENVKIAVAKVQDALPKSKQGQSVFSKHAVKQAIKEIKDGKYVKHG